ncbi:hypothetical protein B0H14DRAFT_2713469 [Mycena olivaceomarginata]|nr:hypothetical protein B0H14DRAFT_2713469 [Mycena olivaceomarginata]
MDGYRLSLPRISRVSSPVHGTVPDTPGLRLHSRATHPASDLRLDWCVCRRLAPTLLPFLSSSPIPNLSLLCSISSHLSLLSPLPQLRPWHSFLPSPPSILVSPSLHASSRQRAPHGLDFPARIDERCVRQRSTRSDLVLHCTSPPLPSTLLPHSMLHAPALHRLALVPCSPSSLCPAPASPFPTPLTTPLPKAKHMPLLPETPPPRLRSCDPLTPRTRCHPSTPDATQA